IRRANAPDRSADRQPSDRVPGGGPAPPAQARRTIWREGAAPLPVGPRDRRGVPRDRSGGPRPEVRRDRARPGAVGAPPPGSMSKFFKALEQAAQEQARRRHPAPSEPMRERGPAVIETELPEARSEEHTSELQSRG